MESMNGLRDLFTMFTLAFATVGFVAVMHLGTLLATSPAFFASGQLPKQSLVMSVSPAEHHYAAAQNPNTLAKPAN
jgi:hypothetical protein